MTATQVILMFILHIKSTPVAPAHGRHFIQLLWQLIFSTIFNTRWRESAVPGTEQEKINSFAMVCISIDILHNIWLHFHRFIVNNIIISLSYWTPVLSGCEKDYCSVSKLLYYLNIIGNDQYYRQLQNLLPLITFHSGNGHKFLHRL